jgi:hypothetical protein
LFGLYSFREAPEALLFKYYGNPSVVNIKQFFGGGPAGGEAADGHKPEKHTS